MLKKTVGWAFLLVMAVQAILVLASSDEQEDMTVENEETPGFPGGKMPTKEELLKALDSMTGLSPEDRESIRKEILYGRSSAEETPDEFVEEGVPQYAGSVFFSQFFMLVAMLSVLALIFVFFSYKLYKSLSDRERKREEKKKNKQLKKKK
ncbi:uncharacterized protein LOC106643026 [Copidosoma floridanum]|uniref:uncharacterized protein LOC106643026 n=1 Tax=Copidosoma floridanum TaxID=29053 RepID=UPI0006C9B15F|nr:uncharacterized protein LOC106643026 [Copidosoma floridanum]XP_014213466.1 uncharacterized protein LOC106643026 [Copidosoma floridanum]